MTEIRDRVYLNNGYFPIAFFSESVNSRFIVENADYLIDANRRVFLFRVVTNGKFPVYRKLVF